jgi:uncharacterized protein with ATP-grasp and redox domains
MRTYLDCIPCFMQQALRAGRIASDDESSQKKILDETGKLFQHFDMSATPAEYGAEVYRIISEITGVKDPYKKIKERSIQGAKTFVPDLKQQIKHSEVPLLTAVKAAIAGNVIDFGVNMKFDLEKDLEIILDQEFAVDDFDKFKRTLEKAETVLYMGDNAGETVFDKLLIEQINKKIYYAVRTIPIINDAVFEDALDSGLDQVAEIVDSGVKAPGAIISHFTDYFKRLFEEADMVISKGQGNYEGLSKVSRPVFFLLKAKCEILARDIGVSKGDIIFESN